MKGNRKHFCRYKNIKRKNKENIGPLLNWTGDLVTKDMEKAEVLNALFVSVFTSKIGPLEPQAPESSVKAWSKEDLHLVGRIRLGNS